MVAIIITMMMMMMMTYVIKKSWSLSLFDFLWQGNDRRFSAIKCLDKPWPPHHPAWPGAAVLYLLLIGATLSYCNLICGYLWLLYSAMLILNDNYLGVFATAHQNSFDASQPRLCTKGMVLRFNKNFKPAEMLPGWRLWNCGSWVPDFWDLFRVRRCFMVT